MVEITAEQAYHVSADKAFNLEASKEAVDSVKADVMQAIKNSMNSGRFHVMRHVGDRAERSEVKTWLKGLGYLVYDGSYPGLLKEERYVIANPHSCEAYEYVVAVWEHLLKKES